MNISYNISLNILEPILDEKSNDPCNPSPCGPFSECRKNGNIAACSCLQNYKGKPPNCRPECVINQECPKYLACSNEKCIDPCEGSCGVNTQCTVVNHSPICTCNPGFNGDPFTACSQTPYSKPSIYHFILFIYLNFVKISFSYFCLVKIFIIKNRFEFIN